MPFIVVFLVIIFLVVIRNVQIVGQEHCYVIERLGQYAGIWKAGLHVKIPFIDNIVNRISLKERVLDFPPQTIITKDNVTINVDSVVYLKVRDAKLYTYGVEDPLMGLQNLTATTLRSIIGGMELDETLSSRERINADMQSILDEATDAWGIIVTRVEIKNITPPAEIEEVMTKQMRAERERRQTLLEAQAHEEAVVARARGDKQAKVLAAEAERDAQIALAEGQAKSIEMVYQAEANGIQKLANSGITDGVLRLRSLDAMKEIADGQATKIFIPNDLSATLSSMGVLAEAVRSEANTNSIPRDKLYKTRAVNAAKEEVANDACLQHSVTPETRSAAFSNAKVQKTMLKTK